MEGSCGLCGAPCEKKCANCRGVFYCSVKHQREHWRSHKKSCPAFSVCRDDKVGRFLVASRNLKFGDVILKEAPLVTGPSQFTAPVCLGCLQEIHENTATKCSRCGWPMCSQECQEAETHAEECRISAARGGITIEHFICPHPIYQCVLTLRCLLTERSCPDKWQQLSQLESHSTSRKDSLQWLSDREHVAKFIPRFFKEQRWTEDEILRVLGIVYINGHEVPLTEPAYVAIYATASLFEHSCLANVAKSFTDAGEIVFWAAQDIRKGDRLSICYTDALWGTQQRQEHLSQTKMFTCSCPRCLDVTELGSNFSALNCETPCAGLLLAKDSNWHCQVCSRTVPKADVESLLEKAAQDASKMKSSVQGCLDFIRMHEKSLPPNHFIMIDVKCVLAQKIGEGHPQELQKAPDELLEMKARLCREILDLIALLAPAENRSHGCMHFELHAALAEIARRGVENGLNCQDLLDKSLWHAEQAARWLSQEPSVLVEGKICAQARINVDTLRVVLQNGLTK
ncbi:SET domain-containing protein SmydA-8-like [Phlebotomus argentipes]|uniref:SET domain-containing protein SmydA-8-like n=1 Tax=Phlebotomus argentipes TaxID=94469 RepID=UPI00289308ED|nr:SET domain-containing protein SmydA-8-like [Phlebotomus argentipes]